MVPKPDGTFRMCVDYRALNDCTADDSWPIPNIAEMFRRIGSQQPKIFGIMDLTQGYHQAPLTLATRAYTAIIIFSGVYEFTRLPFGPKPAPSYFQELMATVVLTGLIYMICEMCIDDYTVFGDTNIEFVSRLKLIFERFRKHNLYLKASKCFLGYSELEFIGKAVSEKRITNIPYENTVCTRLSVTHCKQTAEEFFGNSELSQRFCLILLNNLTAIAPAFD